MDDPQYAKQKSSRTCRSPHKGRDHFIPASSRNSGIRIWTWTAPRGDTIVATLAGPIQSRARCADLHRRSESGRCWGKTQPLPAWCVHDLRRTAATAMADRLGVLPHIVEAVLNHVSGHRAGVAGPYNHARYEAEKRAGLCAWADHVHAIVGASSSGSNASAFGGEHTTSVLSQVPESFDRAAN